MVSPHANLFLQPTVVLSINPTHLIKIALNFLNIRFSTPKEIKDEIEACAN